MLWGIEGYASNSDRRQMVTIDAASPTKSRAFASPMVSAATGFHGNLGGGKLSEEGNELSAAEIDPQHWSVPLIDAMESEDRFGRVDSYAFILGHGRLQFWLFTAQLWHAMPWGRPPQHGSAAGCVSNPGSRVNGPGQRPAG
jgi:hypothetical protein